MTLDRLAQLHLVAQKDDVPGTRSHGHEVGDRDLARLIHKQIVEPTLGGLRGGESRPAVCGRCGRPIFSAVWIITELLGRIRQEEVLDFLRAKSDVELAAAFDGAGSLAIARSVPVTQLCRGSRIHLAYTRVQSRHLGGATCTRWQILSPGPTFEGIA